ncbi:MAG: VanZ family protein [Clostridiales bacterium]|nr:VanZ family protein [Clostridiales bacterium]
MSENLKEKNFKEISVKYVFLAGIFWILTLSWIVVIFLLSADTATQSSNLSRTVLQFINELFNMEVQDDAILRVCAHASEFALLTVFSYLALSSTNKISVKTSYAESPVKLLRSDNEMNIIFTLWFTIINAIFDEYHQLFIDGRDGSIVDVLIDLIGIILVLIIVRIIFTIYMKTKGKSEIIYT